MLLSARRHRRAPARSSRVDDFYKPAHGHIFDAITSLYAAGRAGRPGHRRRRAAPGRPARGHRRPGRPAQTPGRRRRPPPTPAATPASSRSTRSCAGSSACRRDRRARLRRPRRRAQGRRPRPSRWSSRSPERRVTDTTQQLVETCCDENLDRLEQLYERGEAITGTPTGYLDLDEHASGPAARARSSSSAPARPWARPSFALGMAAHAALEAHRPVLCFSLEMSQLELTQRLLCSEARVDSKQVRNGQLTDDDWETITHADRPAGRGADLDRRQPQRHVMEIRAKARRLKSQVGDLGLIVVDYLQLMTGRTTRREPPGRGVRDQPWPQDPRPRARDARSSPCPSSTAASSSGPTSARCSSTSASPGRSSRTPTS